MSLLLIISVTNRPEVESGNTLKVSGGEREIGFKSFPNRSLKEQRLIVTSGYQ